MRGRESATWICCLGLMALYPIYLISLSNNIIKGQENKKSLLSPHAPPHAPPSPIICDRTHYRYDACSINGPTVLDPTTSTLKAVGPNITMQKLRPYPRKWEKEVMSRIKELSLLTVTAPNTTASCHIRHQAPAVVFSTGGYTGNIFHDINDGFLPLFITTRHLLAGHPNRDIVLVVADYHDWWLSKYTDLLRSLTRHPIINLDNDTSLHCFPSATIGLISHGFSTINPSLMPNSESLADFRAFVHSSYAESGLRLPPPASGRPRLVLVAREGTVGRVFLNQEDVVRAAEAVGFEVAVFAPSSSTSVREAYRLINGSHAMVGVHGAALTHLYFLRPKAAMIQVSPLGLGWVGELCYGEAARRLGLEYMEYKIRAEESSLIEKYDRADMVLKNPDAVSQKGWSYTTIYLKQDVRLDLERVTVYLEKAYKMGKNFMEMEGQ
ncbi:hypothetical protein AAC387_Pa03g3274 [Persea americana]